MTDNFMEKKMIKYVIASMDGKYLKKTPAKTEYFFVEDIEVATKFMSKKVANIVLEYFYADTKLDIEMAIIPVAITYELINEINSFALHIDGD